MAPAFYRFMEQRSPRPPVLDDKIYRKGSWTFFQKLKAGQSGFFKRPEAYSKQEELKGMRHAAKRIIRFAERHAELAEAMAAIQDNPEHKAELLSIEVCRWVPAHAPRTSARLCSPIGLSIWA